MIILLFYFFNYYILLLKFSENGRIVFLLNRIVRWKLFFKNWFKLNFDRFRFFNSKITIRFCIRTDMSIKVKDKVIKSDKFYYNGRSIRNES